MGLSFCELVRVLSFWNPAAHAWARTIAKIQEFACDDFLLGQRRVSPQAYGSCLLRAAETAVGSRAAPAGTTGMASISDGSLLKRRVTMILKHRKQPSRHGLAIGLMLGTTALVAGAAFASRSMIQDRRITLEQARRYADIASRESEIPLTVNELVLKRLNELLGTPEGRKFLLNGRARMPFYRPMIEKNSKRLGPPPISIAVPFFESGFRNDAVSPKAHARGIWQFVAATARRYGLVVDAIHDERVDPLLETDAGIQYLKDLNALFGDWRLALKAYNEGERHVQSLIDQYGTRDPWALEKADSTEGYLSGAMAMLIYSEKSRIIRLASCAFLLRSSYFPKLLPGAPHGIPGGGHDIL